MDLDLPRPRPAPAFDLFARCLAIGTGPGGSTDRYRPRRRVILTANQQGEPGGRGDSCAIATGNHPTGRWPRQPRPVPDDRSPGGNV